MVDWLVFVKTPKGVDSVLSKCDGEVNKLKSKFRSFGFSCNRRLEFFPSLQEWTWLSLHLSTRIQERGSIARLGL